MAIPVQLDLENIELGSFSHSKTKEIDPQTTSKIYSKSSAVKLSSQGKITGPVLTSMRGILLAIDSTLLEEKSINLLPTSHRLP